MQHHMEVLRGDDRFNLSFIISNICHCFSALTHISAGSVVVLSGLLVSVVTRKTLNSSVTVFIACAAFKTNCYTLFRAPLCFSLRKLIDWRPTKSRFSL